MSNLEGKALFVHSHVFLYDENNKAYSEGKLSYDVWERYLKHFNNLAVIGRHQNIKDTSPYTISSGENVHHIKAPNLSSIKGRWKNKKKTREILFENISQADVVIARLPSAYSALAIKVAKELKKPYVIELVGDVYSSLWFHGNILGKILAPISFYQTKKILQDAPYVLYVTEKFLQDKYPSYNSRVSVACSNVEINPVFSKSEDIKVRNEKFTIGLIGSYTSKYKGIDNALNVLNRLLDEGYNIQLKILGSGNRKWIDKKIDELQIRDYVKLDGSLPSGPPVLNWLSQLELYIQPSLTEGLPRALIEAMYCELPCIASTVGGIPELLDEDCLHAPKDEEELYKKIKRMYNDEEFRNSQRIKNKEKAKGYEKITLDKKRNDFWEKTIKDIRSDSK